MHLRFLFDRRKKLFIAASHNREYTQQLRSNKAVNSVVAVLVLLCSLRKPISAAIGVNLLRVQRRGYSIEKKEERCIFGREQKERGLDQSVVEEFLNNGKWQMKWHK